MSHGPVDIFAAKDGRVLLIQVKSGSARAKKSELRLLLRWAKAFDARAEVWSFKKGGKLTKLVVRRRENMKSILVRAPQSRLQGDPSIDLTPTIEFQAGGAMVTSLPA